MLTKNLACLPGSKFFLYVCRLSQVGATIMIISSVYFYSKATSLKLVFFSLKQRKKAHIIASAVLYTKTALLRICDDGGGGGDVMTMTIRDVVR